MVTKGDEVERWCERFAASALLPWDSVLSFLREKVPTWHPKTAIEDLKVASKLGRSFEVSLRAAVLRLIEGGLAGWDLYKQIPKTADTKSGGGGGGGRVRSRIRLDEYGYRAATLVLRGMDEDIITRDDANSYLNVRDVELDELRALISSTVPRKLWTTKRDFGLSIPPA